MGPDRASKGVEGLWILEDLVVDDNSPQLCAAADCRKVATQVCGNCKGTPDSKETCYCSEICRKAHREGHNTECVKLNLRRAVYRTGGFVQRLFFDLRDHMWDIDLEKLERPDGQLTMMLSKRVPKGVDPQDVLFMPFPGKDIVAEADRAAVLSKLQGENAILSMFGIIKRCLKGFVKDLEMYNVFVHKHPVLTLIAGLPAELEPDDAYHHYVLRVTLHTGEIFAFDMTSAQYGYTEVVMPWDRYCSERGIEVEDIYSYEMIHELTDPSHSPKDKLRYDLAGAMEDVINEWERNFKPLCMVLKFGKVNYELKVAEIRLMTYDRLHFAFDGLHFVDGPLYLVDDFSIIKDRASWFWNMRFDDVDYGFLDWLLASREADDYSEGYPDDHDDDEDAAAEEDQ